MNFWNSPHSPWPVVPPNEAGCSSDMSNTTAFALATNCWFALSIASGYTDVLRLWLPVANPPTFAHAAAAGAVARNFTNALIAGVSRKVTSESPPISTALALGPGVIVGNGAVLKSVPGLAFVAEVMAPATKSASNTIAPFDGDPKAFVTHVGKSVWSAPLEPPARFALSPTTCAIVFSAFVTEGSVHLSLWALSWLYFASPNVRR